jgi:hypothetical protein
MGKQTEQIFISRRNSSGQWTHEESHKGHVNKTILRLHPTPVRLAITKKTSNKCWQRCGRKKRTLLHCWWECKLALFTIAKLGNQPGCLTTNEWIKKICVSWIITQLFKKMKCHLQENGRNWRSSCWVRKAKLKKPNITCSLSFVELKT